MSDFEEILKALTEYETDGDKYLQKMIPESKVADSETLRTYGPNFWMTYGTGVRNIEKHLVPIYKQAVAECGIPGLAILPYNWKHPTDKVVSSLHCYTGYRDLTAFWDIVDELTNGKREILPIYLEKDVAGEDSQAS